MWYVYYSANIFYRDTESEIVIFWIYNDDRQYVVLRFCLVILWIYLKIFMPPLKKEGHIALHMSVGMSVGMSVSLNLVQLITQEGFVPEASN